MKKVARILPFGASALPVLALAQNVDLTYLSDAVAQIGALVNLLVPLVIAIGLLLFIWGLVTYIAASGDEAAKEEGKRKMIWGIIALFVIVAVWGIVQILVTLTGTNTDAAPVVPVTPV
jgi:hypothetical protein